MNAPAGRIRPARTRPALAEQTLAEAAACAAVAIRCPGDDEMSLAIRADIAALRDQASAGVHQCCDESAGLLSEVSRLAAQLAFAPASPRKLMLALSGLSFAMEAARQLQRAQTHG
jgi:hypothetical protein